MPDVEGTLEKMVSGYIKLRDKRDALKKVHSAEIKKFNDAMGEIEDYLRGHLQASNLTSISCRDATAFLKMDTSATVADMGVFREHVISTRNFDLADFRAKKEAVEEFVANNDGQLPPGVNYSQHQGVQVRRK
jgi:hypothetical protein